MKAWPAAKELRTDAAVEGPIGLAALVIALLNGAPLPWLFPLLGIALLALTWALRGRDRRYLEGLEPLSDGVVVSRYGRWYLHELPEQVVLVGTIVYVSQFSLWPLALLGALWSASAIHSLVQAWDIDRFERERGVRVVHVRENLLVATSLRVVAH